MNCEKPTKAQAGLLREIERWGELSMDAEHATGCHGAAFERVLRAIERRGWIEGDQTVGMRLTPKGRCALQSHH